MDGNQNNINDYILKHDDQLLQVSPTSDKNVVSLQINTDTFLMTKKELIQLIRSLARMYNKMSK